MFRMEMLPAAHGDCLWIEYGTEADRHRILIDGGPPHMYPVLRERIGQLPRDSRHFDLLVITHIDEDHIGGIIRLLQDAEALNCRFDRIWFNGPEQLNQVPDPAGMPLGALQGELLTLLIKDYEQRTGRQVHNADLPDGIAGFDRAGGQLPVVSLPGHCRLTLLSPDYEMLLNLKDKWREELDDAGIDSGDELSLRLKLAESKTLQPLGDILGGEEEADEEGFEFPDPGDSDSIAALADVLGGSGESGADSEFGSDASPANGSSIAFLLEYTAGEADLSFLLIGDAQPNVLIPSLDSLLKTAGASRLKVTGLKLSHHGSTGNISPDLLERLSCKHYFISTSGVRFRHPHARTVDLVLDKHNHRAHPRLHFNYMTVTTSLWSSADRQKKEKFKAFYPTGLQIEL